MKKFFSAALSATFFAGCIFAQDMPGKIPANASLVLKYAGGNLTQKMPVEKFDSYAILKKKFFNALKTGDKSIQSTGLNFQQDAWQYLTATDSTTSFVTLIAVKDAAKFSQFIKTANKENIPVIAKNGFQLYPVSANTFLGWDGKMAALVISFYTSHRYFVPPVSTDTASMYGDVGKMVPYADSSIALEKSANVTEAAAENASDTAAAVVDSMVTITEPAIEVNTEETAEQKATREANELFYKQEAILKDSIQKANAENILQAVYNTSVASIKDNISFTKLVDENADIIIWMDSSSLLSKFSSYAYPSKFNFNMLPGYTQAVNVFFEKDKVKIEQQLFFGNDEAARLFKSVYGSKQNPSFVNYLRAGDIGHVSISLNSEALMNFYYGAAKKILTGMPYIGKEAELIDAYVDIMEIMIDEKAIADVLPGNALFVLHGLKPRKVKYIAYDYDDNFNGTETTKTKTEMSPDFSIFFETRNEKIFNKLINLPIKLNKDSTFNYKKTGNFYTLDLGEKNIIEKLYFMVKEGKCVISTSLQDINGTPLTEKNAIDAAARQSVLNSNYSGNINFKNLITGLSAEVTDKKNKKMISYLYDNVSNLTFESTIKEDLVKTTTILNITGKHKNSLEYFFNVIENLLKIEAGNKK
jgi:hypothetical protein